MLYSLEMGAVEQGIVDQSRRAGLPIPDRILNRPELLPHLEIYFQAFFDLQAEGGENSIPWTAMKEYSEYYGFSEDQADVLFFVIPEMDNTQSKHTRKKNAS